MVVTMGVMFLPTLESKMFRSTTSKTTNKTVPVAGKTGNIRTRWGEVSKTSSETLRYPLLITSHHYLPRCFVFSMQLLRSKIQGTSRDKEYTGSVLCWDKMTTVQEERKPRDRNKPWTLGVYLPHSTSIPSRCRETFAFSYQTINLNGWDNSSVWHFP